jgi:hypothetical protein
MITKKTVGYLSLFILGWITLVLTSITNIREGCIIVVTLFIGSLIINTVPSIDEIKEELRSKEGE